MVDPHELASHKSCPKGVLIKQSRDWIVSFIFLLALVKGVPYKSDFLVCFFCPFYEFFFSLTVMKLYTLGEHDS